MTAAEARALALAEGRRTGAILRENGVRAREAYREITGQEPPRRISWGAVERLVAALEYARLMTAAARRAA